MKFFSFNFEKENKILKEKDEYNKKLDETIIAVNSYNAKMKMALANNNLLNKALQSWEEKK